MKHAKKLIRNPVQRTPMNINAGNGFVFVSRRGKVFPSDFSPLSAGNVRQNSLAKIYQNAPLFRQLRQPDTFDERCGQREFRTVCGGSRSRAYAIHGHAHAEEAFCTYEPHSFPYQAQVATYVGEK